MKDKWVETDLLSTITKVRKVFTIHLCIITKDSRNNSRVVVTHLFTIIKDFRRVKIRHCTIMNNTTKLATTGKKNSSHFPSLFLFQTHKTAYYQIIHSFTLNELFP